MEVQDIINSTDPTDTPTSTKTRVVKKRASGLPRRGKKPYPKERLRVLISVRILPSTKEALLRLRADNLGRAIDELTTIAHLPTPENSTIPVTLVYAYTVVSAIASLAFLFFLVF